MNKETKKNLFVVILGCIILIGTVMTMNRGKPDNKWPSLKSYRIETNDSEGKLAGGNSADIEGQLSYGAMFLPGRHDDWQERVIREYEVAYVPKDEKDCGLLPEHAKEYDCPPFGRYAKCNPGGCAGGTTCKADVDCPGVSGKCIRGKCLCCQQGNDCRYETDCGGGSCVEGKCDCSDFDMSYKCNVDMYPKGTNKNGSTTHVGAVKAPVDRNAYSKDDWVPGGWWYSFPEDGECKKGQKMGESCYWKTIDSSNAPTLKDLADKGFKFYCGPNKENPSKGCYTKKEVSKNQKENQKILEKTFGV